MLGFPKRGIRLPLRCWLLTASLLLAAGCDGFSHRHTDSHLMPQTSEAVLSYRFIAADRIDDAELRRIRRFLDGLALDRGDILLVSVPYDASPARTEARRKRLAGILAASRARIVYEVAARPSGATGSDHTGIIRVVSVVSARTDCPTGQVIPGCATAQNLSAMIAMPADVFHSETGRRYKAPQVAEPLSIGGLAP